ncbi:MAG: hypothetical protein QXW69_06420 [Nitrososphaerota archaeon]
MEKIRNFQCRASIMDKTPNLNIILQRLKENFLSFKRKDSLLIMLVVPLVLLSIFWLPSDIKSLLALHPKNITPWSLLTANYIHFELDHLPW